VGKLIRTKTVARALCLTALYSCDFLGFFALVSTQLPFTVYRKAKMGGEKAQERVLIMFYQELSDEVQKDIRRKFSDAEVTIHKSVAGIPVPPGMLN
jgi:hypothetical protein